MILAPLLALSTLPAYDDPPAEKRVEFAVVGHPDNESNGLTQRDFERIFKAEKLFWDDKERIYLTLPRSSSLAKEFLLDEVYELDEAELKRYWLELVFQNKIPNVPRVLASSALTLAFVAKKTKAIALVRADEIGEKAKVRVFAIGGKSPGDEGYPLFVMVAEEDREEAPADAPEDQALAAAGGLFLPASIVARGEEEQESTDERLSRLEDELGALRDQMEYEEEIDQGFMLGPKLHLRGFADVRFVARDTDPGLGDDVRSNAFALGQFDLFITSELSERLSALSEIVFTAKSDGSNRPNIERAIIKYNVSDGLNIQAGRFHTTLGHWNEAYHHGEWFHTTIGRPQIVNFNGGGGLLPIHVIGVVLKGNKSTERAMFDYTIEVGNGRGPTRGFDQVASDANDIKAVNFAFGVQPISIEGLRFGGGLYVDEIPSNANAAAGPLHGAIDERILNAFATYYGESWEVLAEYFQIDHQGEVPSADPDTDSGGYYLQVGRKLGEWTPYGRIEAVDVDDASTFFENPNDLERYVVGARWDFSTWSALKFQLSYSDIESPGGIESSQVEFAVQWSNVF